MGLTPQQASVASWSGTVEGWTVNYITRNLWRFMPVHDFDDLYQECFVFFLDCVRRYITDPDPKSIRKVTQPQHFFALYKITIVNVFNDLATARTKQRALNESDCISSEGDSVSLAELAVDTEVITDAEIEMMIKDAPEPIRKVVEAVRELGGPVRYNRVTPGPELYENQPDGTQRLKTKSPNFLLRRRETTDDYLNRLAGTSIPNFRELVIRWVKGEPCAIA